MNKQDPKYTDDEKGGERRKWSEEGKGVGKEEKEENGREGRERVPQGRRRKWNRKEGRKE